MPQGFVYLGPVPLDRIFSQKLLLEPVKFASVAVSINLRVVLGIFATSYYLGGFLIVTFFSLGKSA